MCFSADASFIAGTVLSGAGIASLKKTGSRNQLAFAAIPLIFGIQQFTEGFLWLSFLNPDYHFFRQPATYVFLTFAQVIWPSWVPFSVLMMEKDIVRRKVLYFMQGIGILVSVFLAFRLITTDPVAEISNHHILYHLGFSIAIIRSMSVLYFIATVVAPFVSRIKKMWSLGLTILFSYIISRIFFENYVISVWCFLAAVISIAVYWVIVEVNKPSSQTEGVI
jgi:hypothetical protein